MRFMLSAASVLFVGLIGCKTQGPIASQSTLADNPVPDDPAKVCPDICGLDTPCLFPDGSCEIACNPCYCRRDGGTVVGACPRANAIPREFQAAGVPAVAMSDGDRSR
ncbi:MAG TPA: hypothetical protein VHT91_47550 [Kofleriaceae bacterium]|jgi:hypothetical protein|nr:hypothetical protein [Kofleriaceae bacterium]